MKWNGREEVLIHDIIAIVLGILIVCTSGFVFWNVEKHFYMFPVIFLLGAVLGLLNGRRFLKKKRRLPGMIVCAAAVLLVICSVASFLTMVK